MKDLVTVTVNCQQERQELVSLVVTEHFKHDGLRPDVVNEGLGHCYCELSTRKARISQPGSGQTLQTPQAGTECSQ